MKLKVNENLKFKNEDFFDKVSSEGFDFLLDLEKGDLKEVDIELKSSANIPNVNALALRDSKDDVYVVPIGLFLKSTNKDEFDHLKSVRVDIMDLKA